MNYKLEYKKIIDNANMESREKNGEVYYESHHIIPEFMFKVRKRKGPSGHIQGKSNAKNNLCLLTFQEHLLCHYYLYEILKGTRYMNSAGSALQFFFTHATGSHKRQINLSEVDKKFLDEMAFLREIGISSISMARIGKMPVKNSITNEIIGSVEVDHPNVLSGEWIHVTKGRKQSKEEIESHGSKCGEHNNNYKKMTPDRRNRIFECVSKSISVDGTFRVSVFLEYVKSEFIEFKKVSGVWVINNFGSMSNLINEYNKEFGTNHTYSRYNKCTESRNMLRDANLGFVLLNNGEIHEKVQKDDVDEFLRKNPNFIRGKIKVCE